LGKPRCKDRSCTAGEFEKEPVECVSRVAYVAMNGKWKQDALAQLDYLDDLKEIALAVGGRRSRPLSPFAMLSHSLQSTVYQ
jgi:hypothetical protein